MSDRFVKPEGGWGRRKVLDCMAWGGLGVVWTVAGGVPGSRMLDSAQAANAGFTFAQISDTHVGFDKPANPDPLATLNQALDQIAALPRKPDFILHTGDITHTAKPEQFELALKTIARLGIQVFYAPGEHDIVDPATARAYMDRFGKGARDRAYYAFDHKGVHFISINNVVDLKAKGLGYLGADQIAWIAEDLKGKSAETPLVLFCHMPLWMIAPEWGWGTEDSQQLMALLARFGSVTVMNGHIHQIMQKVEGRATFHTARSTAFPQPVPGAAPAPGPLKVPAGQLRGLLGIADVAYAPGGAPLAITDQPLMG
ncbi:3',5'-cyclic AMP phosphodiesterase CpdA [Rhodoblastus acidophilus]|uniref:metallophosphoesterase family protein n=1 Tax=Rhodoblastus acidophilus TaxID=1074 RepID=UPI002224CC96|nr:metallophosphoesterase [Rhodoblastus acidophilus]MCW2319268.1 3',5'-cyclic AMP phosphodiesterase CpdA [Rhodoblastus acidophilus]